MMKKLTAFLLALVMILSMVPNIAFASELENVSVLVTEPVAGAAPKFAATCNHDNYYVDTAYGGSFTNGVLWYDETDKKALSTSDRFREGHSYTVSVVLEPTSGNKFALNTDVGVKTAVSGMVNGKNAKVKLSADSALKVVVSYTFVLAETVTSVSVLDVKTPLAGQKPSYVALAASLEYQLKSGKDGSYKDGVSWYDLTASAALTEDSTFVEGHRYRVFLCLEAADGAKFATDKNGSHAVTATVNGMKANAAQYGDAATEDTIAVYYDFPACEKPVITKVDITELPIPQAGKAPEYTAKVSDGVALVSINNAFTQNGICWSHAVKGYDMTPSSFFMSDHLYKVTLRLTPQEGFALSQTVTATVNGEAATAVVSGGQITVTYEVRCPVYQIDKVAITGVSVPAIGETPSLDMTCADPNLYVVKSANWNVDDSLMDSTAKFIAGKNYDLVIWLDPKEEGWDRVALFADKVAVTVNGKAVSEKKVERIGNSLKVTYTFTAADAAKIGACHVTGIDAPVAGATPDYTATLPNSDTYKIADVNDKHTKNGITWYNVTEGETMVVGTVDNKFEKGSVYEVYVTLEPHDGYQFRTKKDGTPDVGGTVNGETVYEVMGRSEYEAILVYRFPATEAAPSEKPGSQGSGTQGGGSASEQKNQFTDVEKGAYYYDSVMWAVAEGITTGTSATTFSPNASCTRAQVVTFLHRMVGSPEPAAINFPFADVPINSYYFKPVKWAVGSKITGGTSATTFSPNADCTRAQVVTFLWRAAGQPKASGSNPFADVKEGSYYYDAVLWAVEKGITSGTSATTFSPDRTCTRAQVVTFLYRFINQ